MTARTSMFTLAALVATPFCVGGCAGGPLDDEEDARSWANNASAVAIYAHAYEPLAFADGEMTYDDPTCPVTSDDGTVAAIAGGCTDSTGRQWIGRATVTRASDGGRTLVFDGFGAFDDPAFRSTKNGTVTVRELDATSHEFDVSLMVEGGVNTTIEYSGSVEGGYTGPTVWNGTGTVERDGLVEPNGTVTVTTVSETLDSDVCGGQAVSGTTTISGDGHLVVIEYDGATDCDDAQAARWSYDGEDRGALTGVVCSASPARHDMPMSALLGVLGVSFLAVARKRARRSRRRQLPSFS